MDHLRDNHFDVIAVGSGFATSFFLHGYLPKMGSRARVLILEQGPNEDHDRQIEIRAGSSLDYRSLYKNEHPHKLWRFTPGFGGSSKTWWACTPRFLPHDFKLRSTYGVGRDWPLTYEELEPYYCRAERIMEVSGTDRTDLFPRSMPFPQPPHRLSEPDKILARAYPRLYFPQPTARARLDTATRPACCAIGACSVCPIGSAFTILNGFRDLYSDPRITLLSEARAVRVLTRARSATGVEYLTSGGNRTASADLVILGGGSLFNPHVLLRSGLDGPQVGRNLHEQVSIYVRVDLDGIDNYQGSTSITGHGYMLYDGDHRSQRAACLLESYNVPQMNRLRPEKGKWRQRMMFKCIIEDLPDPNNRVRIARDDSSKPETIYSGHSEYTQRTLDELPRLLGGVLSPLPVERITFADSISRSDGHIIGTAVMGDDPSNSVVDRCLKHHQIRNLLVLGSGSYPSSTPANPALTLSALSLWAADRL